MGWISGNQRRLAFQTMREPKNESESVPNRAESCHTCSFAAEIAGLHSGCEVPNGGQSESNRANRVPKVPIVALAAEARSATGRSRRWLVEKPGGQVPIPNTQSSRLVAPRLVLPCLVLPCYRPVR